MAAHDTTGGMSTKIAEAASIAAMGIDVYIVEVSMLICLITSEYQLRSNSNFLPRLKNKLFPKQLNLYYVVL